MEIIAHRGAAFEAPENSLEAFRRAIDEGADRLELDVHITLDGAVVVSHDPDTARCGDATLEIGSARLDELRFVRLDNGEPLPLLSEVCALASGRVTLDVEIKSPGQRTVEETLRTLDEYGMKDDTLLTSFDANTIRAARRLGVRGPLGLLVGSKSLSPAQRMFEAWPVPRMRAMGADTLVIHHRLAHAALRRALGAAGYGLYLWMSIDDEMESPEKRAAAYRRAAEIEPAGLIVARVREARNVLGLPAPSPTSSLRESQ